MDKSKTERKTTGRNFFLHIWSYKIVWRNKNQDCYIRVFTLHWSIAETDFRRLRKCSFRVKLGLTVDIFNLIFFHIKIILMS